jgi:hypothetical protein
MHHRQYPLDVFVLVFYSYFPIEKYVNENYLVIFQVLTATSMKISAFGDIAS